MLLFVSVCMCNELRGVIWPDSHNFLLWSHGRLLSMKSLVRVLPAAAYTFNTVPICDPGGPNPHGLVWETFPTPVRDFTPRLYYFRETGFPKPDFRSRTLVRRRTHSELDYLPIRLQTHGPIPWTNPFTIRPFSGVSHYYWGVGLLLNSLPKPDFRSRTHLEFSYLPIRLQIHGPIPWTNPFTIIPFSGVSHYYWDVGLLLDSLPKPDFRSRTHLELGYLQIRLQIHGPIPWTNPFTIRPFSGVSHYYWDVGLLLDSLPKPDFRSRTHLELGYLPIRLQMHGPIPWTNPFTYWILFGCPTLSLGCRTTGKGIGANTHHCVSNSDRMAGWTPQPVIRATNWSSNDMGMNVYISQWKYIPYLTSIHALSPYELSHTIIPATCVYNWFNNR